MMTMLPGRARAASRRLLAVIATVLVSSSAPCSAFSFQPIPMPVIGSWPKEAVIADLDGDGRNDVIVATDFNFDAANDYRVFWFRQAADGTLEPPQKVPHYGRYGTRTSMVAADVDDDGRADVYIGGSINDGVRRCRLEFGVFGCNAQRVVTGSFAALALADVDSDGDIDLLGGDCNSSVAIVENIGAVSGTVSNPATLAMPAGPCGGIVVRDVNGDERVDIATFAISDPVASTSVRFRQASGVWSAPITRGVPGNSAFSAEFGTVLDIGNDGLADLVVSGGGNSPVNLHAYRQTAPGVIGEGVPFPTYDIPATSKSADLDLDGYEDLVVLHDGWGDASVYMGTAAGLAAEVRYAVPVGYSDIDSLALGDIDGDGCTDAVIANGGLSALRGTGCNLPLFRDGFE